MKNSPSLPANERFSKFWRSLFGKPYVYFNVKMNPKTSMAMIEYDYNSAFLNMLLEDGHGNEDEDPDDTVRRAIAAVALNNKSHLLDEEDDDDEEDNEEDGEDNYIHMRNK